MSKKVKVFEPLTDVVPYQVKSGTGRKIVRQAQSQLAQMNYRENMVEAASTDAQRKQFHGVNKKGVNTTEIRGVGSVKKFEGAAPEGRTGASEDWSELDRGHKIPNEQHKSKILEKSSQYKNAYGQYKKGQVSKETVERAKGDFFGTEKHFGSTNVLRPCAGEGCVNPIAKERESVALKKPTGEPLKETVPGKGSKVVTRNLQFKELKKKPTTDSTLCATCSATEKGIQNQGNALKGVSNRERR